MQTTEANLIGLMKKLFEDIMQFIESPGKPELEAVHLGIMLRDCRAGLLLLPLAQVPGASCDCTAEAGHWAPLLDPLLPLLL